MLLLGILFIGCCTIGYLAFLRLEKKKLEAEAKINENNLLKAVVLPYQKVKGLISLL